MANKNKDQGTRWESQLRDHLNEQLGHVDADGRFIDPFDAGNVRRPAQEGARDVGDVHVVPFILEAKDVTSSAVPTWLRQADAEAQNAGFPYGVVVVKVRRASTARGRVHVSIPTWTRLRQALGLDAPTMRDRYGFRPSLRGLDTSRWYLTTDVAALARIIQDARDVLRFADAAY